MELEFKELISIKTKRNCDPEKENIENKVENKNLPQYTTLLFNIHPFHTYDLGLKHYKIDPVAHLEPIDKLLTIKNLKEEDYKEYKKITKKIGSFKVVKYIRATHPILENIIEADWNLVRIVNEKVPPSWREAFKIGFKEILSINDLLIDQEEAGKILCPQKKDIFRAFELCPLNNVKVVILGQDPYHSIYQDKPVANGLAFSTNRGYRIQPSLLRIYKLLKKTIKDFKIPDHGDLSIWAQRGVLLLNTALTTIKHKAGAHSVHWEGFTTHIISVINKVKPECIYMLWGNHALKMKRYIHHTKNILEANHPSPLVRRSNFLECNHIAIANNILRESGQDEIDWNLD